MKSIKNRYLIINILFIIVIMLIIILFFYKRNNKKIVSSITSNTTIFILPKYQTRKIVKQDKIPTYNYSNMIILMKKCKFFKQKINRNYSLFLLNKINIKHLTLTLKELELEKSYFKQYMKQINNYYRRKIPSKKRNSIRYHFRVIENKIAEIKRLIEKFNLNVKLKNL